MGRFGSLRSVRSGALPIALLLASSYANAQTAEVKAQTAPPPAPAAASPPAQAAADPGKAPQAPVVETPAAPIPSSAPTAPSAGTLPPLQPSADLSDLVDQGKRGPHEDAAPTASSSVFADDWWTKTRPEFEIHGYFRLRGELMHDFNLGRYDSGTRELWPTPVGHSFFYSNPKDGERTIKLCGDDPKNPEPCDSGTQSGANMRFRIAPELHISDNLRVLSQIDMLDNLVLGSTPDGYANEPQSGGYSVVPRGGYSALGGFSTTQWAPSSGQNSYEDSVVVKRVWAEYMTPIGLLRFGRMPSHWGLGMLANGGEGYDADWQSTADRVMLITGIKKYDLYFMAGIDFLNEGAISATGYERQGQAHDLGELDDVDQYVFAVARRRSAELQKLELARGEMVHNGGVYFVYRTQELANDTTDLGQGAGLGNSSDNVSGGLTRRGLELFVPDVWYQFLYEKFRLELEGALIIGSLDNTGRDPGQTIEENPLDENDPGWKIAQFGLATQMEYRAIDDKLRIQMGFGYASGDDDVDSLAPQGQELQPQRTSDRTFSTFRFHPAYQVDMILFRHVLSRVQGAYYFRPSVEYDFTRAKNGEKLGGSAALIWSRASEFVQTPGHAHDLGLELNFSLYYQSKDGSLNDDQESMGGFFAQLQYGVLFPLGGFDYLPKEVETFKLATGADELETTSAQMVRLYLGVFF